MMAMRRNSQLFRAIEFAAKAHRGQYRKGTKIPYIVHPLAVCRILIDVGAPRAVIIAGLLHDTIEDTGVTLADLRKTFGPAVARLVAAASEPDKSESWEIRKRHTISFLQKEASRSVLLLSCADKLDNIRAIRADRDAVGEAVWGRFNRSRALQKWYYENLADAFRRRICDAQTRSLSTAFAREVRSVFGKS